MDNYVFSPYIENINGNAIVKLDKVRKIARKTGLSIKDVEITLLKHEVIPYRYTGNVRLIGIEGQVKLLNSTVCIVGCGGLGGLIAEFCARLGIGRLILIDGDVFDESNLNRQLFSIESLLGMSKVECGKKRINDINSGIEVITHNTFLNSENVKQLINGSNCIIDALDNVDSRFLIQDTCKELAIPMVHGAIGNSQVHVTSIFPGEDNLNNLYSRENCDYPVPGNPIITVSICAAIEVAAAVKIIIGMDGVLKNKLLHFDWLYNDFNIIDI